MAAARAGSSGSSLLAVFAHPDDESLACGGLLARCAASGARVSLLCLTRGEHGARRDREPYGQGPRPVDGAEPLGDARARELAEAARLLGVHDVVLLEHEDGMLPWIDASLLEADIASAMRRFRPDAVVTFDRDGLYWHPDHIAVHERVTAVVAGLGTAGPALLYATVPPGAMRALVEAASASGPPDAAEPCARILGVDDPDAFGSMAPEPTLLVEAGPFAGLKLAALRCHRTQVAGSALDRVADEDALRILGRERYRRAEVGARGEVFVERFGTPLTAGS